MAPVNELPTVDELAELSHRALVAYAIRCAQRAEPLYIEKNLYIEKHQEPIRARYVRETIESAIQYLKGEFSRSKVATEFDTFASDHALNAAEYARYTAEECYNSENDPDYDAEMAEDDETTPAHRAKCAASFSLAATYETNLPLEEARRTEKITLQATLSDFRALQKLNNTEFDIDELGPLWADGAPEFFVKRAERLQALLDAGSQK